MKRAFRWVAVLGLLTACGASPQAGTAQTTTPHDGTSLEAAQPPISSPASMVGASAIPTLETILPNYRDWRRLTAKPRNVAPSLWAFCRLPTADEKALLESPHSGRFLQVYVNEKGGGVIGRGGGRVFPAGSVVVKGKLAASTDTLPEGIGIMIKREKGFNPEGGDWEYAYWEKTGRIARGRQHMASCQSCHIAKKQKDSVFWPSISSGNISAQSE